MLLKISEKLRGVKNYSLVMNTPGSQILGVFGISIRTGLQKKFLMTNIPGSIASPEY
jgi:hypothetical protein